VIHRRKASEAPARPGCWVGADCRGEAALNCHLWSAG
jgi:hypothetical protein